MTCTEKQIRQLMKLQNTHTRGMAALKAGIDRKTASKYIKARQLPSELQKKHTWSTRQDPFEEVWPVLAAMLEGQPRLEAKTLLEWLIEKNIGKEPPPFCWGQLRTLQRRTRDWRALHGAEREVMFPQNIKPGKQSQSDCTCMNDLAITIAGNEFPHLLFHFMLPYSRWEHVSICYSESFDSLTEGYTEAVWHLGVVAPEHRTDNLTAATHAFKGSREFNEAWLEFLTHHHVKPSRNNPGESHENGSVEKSNDLFKKSVDQQLMLRGYRDFSSIASYEEFINKIQRGRNASRQRRLQEELSLLRCLPDRKWSAPDSLVVTVNPASAILVCKGIYSVPSRLIGYTLTADVFSKKIDVRYGNRFIQSMPRLPKDQGYFINYCHIIGYLLRKPGAFLNYQYREALFPRVVFRKAYDALIVASAAHGIKDYLQVLHLAAIGCENDVATALEVLLEGNIVPISNAIKGLLDMPLTSLPIVNIDRPQLNLYDHLLSPMTGRA